MPEKYIDINAVHIEFPETTNPYISAKTKAYQKGWNDACKSIREKAPAAEVEPMVHGHIVWRHRHSGGYEYKECPACGTEIETRRPVEADEPYCSECGAQMAESFQRICPRCGAHMSGASSAVTQPQYESRSAVLIKIKDALIACNPHVTGITTTHSGGTAVILYDNGESRKAKIAGESLQGIAYEIFKTAIYGEKEKK